MHPLRRAEGNPRSRAATPCSQRGCFSVPPCICQRDSNSPATSRHQPFPLRLCSTGRAGWLLRHLWDYQQSKPPSWAPPMPLLIRRSRNNSQAKTGSYRANQAKLLRCSAPGKAPLVPVPGNSLRNYSKFSFYILWRSRNTGILQSCFKLFQSCSDKRLQRICTLCHPPRQITALTNHH